MLGLFTTLCFRRRYIQLISGAGVLLVEYKQRRGLERMCVSEGTYERFALTTDVIEYYQEGKVARNVVVSSRNC
jgi:hypothetical protein